MLTNLDSITTKLDRGEGTMAKLLNDPNLHESTSAAMGDLESVLGTLVTSLF